MGYVHVYVKGMYITIVWRQVKVNELEFEGKKDPDRQGHRAGRSGYCPSILTSII